MPSGEHTSTLSPLDLPSGCYIMMLQASDIFVPRGVSISDSLIKPGNISSPLCERIPKRNQKASQAFAVHPAAVTCCRKYRARLSLEHNGTEGSVINRPANYLACWLQPPRDVEDLRFQDFHHLTFAVVVATIQPETKCYRHANQVLSEVVRNGGFTAFPSID